MRGPVERCQQEGACQQCKALQLAPLHSDSPAPTALHPLLHTAYRHLIPPTCARNHCFCVLVPPQALHLVFLRQHGNNLR